MTTEEDFCEIHKQFIAKRSTGRLTNLNRLEIQSPYDKGYSRFQLDMRRKAEVLKYRSIGGGGGGGEKVGNLTKKQIWAQIARQRPTVPASFSTDTCPSSIVITPSTASNIPGPAIPLYLDPSIPLYKYIPSTEAYGISVNNNIIFKRNNYNYNPIL